MEKTDEDLFFLKSYCKAWGITFDEFLKKIISDKVIELQSGMIKNETFNND